MKHIVLFESYNQDYYVKITYDEWWDLVNCEPNDNKDVFNRKEVDFFNNNTTISYWGGHMSSGISTSNEFNKSFLVVILTHPRGIKKDYTGISFIHKLKDDYFVVRMNMHKGYESYKCDQFEGLIKLLKDKGIILI